MKSINIFISYRRNDSAGHARALYEELKKDFRVFFDIEGIEYGDIFPESIERNLKKADVVLVVIGDDSEEEFKSRLDSEIKDYVALEIAYAKKLNKDIIPVLVGNANMPQREYIPDEISFFPNLNAYTVRHDKFSSDMIGLKKRIREKHFQVYNWHIILALIIIVGTIFSFEKPREYVIDLRDDIKEWIDKPPKKEYAFSLTDNLSRYSLMPNPTFEEWQKFSTNLTRSTKEDYDKFIKIKNNIESNNLFKSSYHPSYSSSSTSVNLSDNKVTHTETHGGNSSNLSTNILKDLLALKEKNSNSLIDYYIGIIKLHFGNRKIEDMINAIKNIKAQGYREYAYDLEQISITVKDRNLSKINENNHLLNPQYYLDLNITNKLKDIELLKEMNYSFASFTLILQNSSWSNDIKLKAVKSFLKKDEKSKEENGNIILAVYLNLFTENTKDSILRLIRRYPIDFKNKTYLLTLLSLNRYIDEDEFSDILEYQKEFLEDVDVKTSKIKEQLLEIKKGKKDISVLFDFFLRNQDRFSDDLKIIRLTKQLLEGKKECTKVKEKLYNLSFLLYMQSLYDLEDTNSMISFHYTSDKVKPKLLKSNIENFYKNHKLIYLSCIKKNSNIPLDIENFGNMKDINLTKDFVLYGFKNLADDINRSKQLNILMGYEQEELVEVMHLMKGCISNHKECEKAMKYIPVMKTFIDDWIKDMFHDDDFPIIVNMITSSAKQVYIENDESILIGKFTIDEFIEQFSKNFKSSIEKTEKFDKSSCYLFYAVEDVFNHMDDENLSIDKFIGNSYLELCKEYKLTYVENRDFLLYLGKQTLYSDIFNDWNISTSTLRLEELASESKYDFKLLNLLKPSFYKEETKYLKRRINMFYSHKYEPSLVSSLMFIYLCSNDLKYDKYMMFTDIISSLEEGKYIYNFNLDKKLQQELGYINLTSFTPEKPSTSWDMNIDTGYYFNIEKNQLTLTITIKGNIKNFLDFTKMVKLIKEKTEEGLKPKDVIKLLKQNYSIKRLSTLLNFFISDIWGKNELWAYHELIKIYKKLEKEDEDKRKELYYYYRLKELFLEKKEYKNAIKYSKINLKLLQDINKTNSIPYQYLTLGTLHRLNQDKNLSKKYYQKSKKAYLEWMDINASESYPYTNLFRLSLIQDKPFDKKIETEFIKRFKDDNKTMIYYDARKILSDITFGKEYNLNKWMKKYTDVPIETDWFHINAWIKQKKDVIIKAKLQHAITVFKSHLKSEQIEKGYQEKIKKIKKSLEENKTKENLIVDLAVEYDKLGELYFMYYKLIDKAEEAYLNALRTRLSLKSYNRLDLAINYFKLAENYVIFGDYYTKRNHFNQANDYYQKAINHFKNTITFSSANFTLNNYIWTLYLKIARNHTRQNKLNSSSIAFKKAINHLKSSNEVSSQKLATLSYKLAKEILENYNNRGDNYKKEKKIDKALTDYINGLKFSKDISLLDTNNTTWQNEIFIQQIKIADSYKNQKDYNQSLVYYNDGLKVIKKLYDSNTSYRTWQLNLSLVYNRLGEIYELESDLDKALENYLKAFEIIKSALELNPLDKELKSRLIYSTKSIKSIINLYIKRANSLIKKSKFNNAISVYQEAIKLLETDNGIEKFPNYIALFNINIGNIYKYKKEFDKALDSYTKSLTIREKLYKENPKNSYYKHKLHQNYERIAGIYHFSLKNFDRAKNFYRRALNIYSCTYSFSNLYKLQIITNQEINKSFEQAYIKAYQDKKEKFIKYEMLKIIKDLTQNKKIDLKAWQNKYEGIYLDWGFAELDEWVKTLKDKTLKKKINEALEIFKRHTFLHL